MFLIDKYKNDINLSYSIVDKLLDSLNTHNQIYTNIDNVVKEDYDSFKNIIDNIKI